MHMIFLFALFAILQLVLLYHFLRLLAKKRSEDEDTTPLLVISFLLMVIGPFAGITMTNGTEGERPFDHHTILTPITWTILMNLFYWTSFMGKKYLSPVLLAILPVGLLASIIYMVVLSIHLGPYLAAGVFIPVLGFPAVCPPLIACLLMKELAQLSAYIRYDYELAESNTAIPFYKHLLSFFRQSLWAQSPVLLFATFPLFLLVQGVLVLLGQPVDSYIRTFADGCGFTFSVSQNCYTNTGGHYLCSIAANGDQKLVKPLRYGYRAGGYITVNRQLLIANAFEQYLEIKIPRLHRIIRNGYDACNIPVDEWCRNKLLANLIYLLMKPLELGFLVWLYVMDKSPENRIARQYLPPQMLQKQ